MNIILWQDINSVKKIMLKKILEAIAKILANLS